VAPGGQVRLVGSGFTAGTSVFANLQAGAPLQGPCSTDGGGSFDCTLTVPSNAAGGAPTLNIGTSFEFAAAALTIASSLAIAPTTGPVGTTIALTAAGIGSNFVEVRLDNSFVGNCSVFNGSIGGTFSPPCSVTIPAATAGQHTIGLFDSSVSF